MADNDAASYAFTVPGLGVTPGQALMFKQQQAQQEQLRRDAINERAQYRQDQERTRSEFRQSNLLKEEFNPTKYQTDVGLVDQYAQKKLSDLLRQYSDPKYASMPLNEFTGMIMNEVSPIASGASAVKSKLAHEADIIKKAAAQNKYLDEGKLLNDVKNRVANEFMVPDQKGGFAFRPLDQVNMSKSPTLDALSSPDAYKYMNDNAIRDYIKGIKESATSANTQSYSLKRPDGGTTIYQGKASPFQQVTEVPDQYGFVKQQPRYSVISEPGRVDRMGNPIKTVPEEVINRLTDTPANAMVFNRKFAEYAGAKGVDINDPVEKQRFAYDMLNGILGDNQPFVHSQQQPQRAAHTTINNAAAKEVGIRDIYGEVTNKLAERKPGFDMPFNELSPTAQEILLKHANNLSAGLDEKLNQSNVQVGKRGDGQIHLINTATGKSIMPITYEDINTSANTGTKAKQQVIKNASQGSNQPKSTPTRGATITPKFSMK